jgi:hypothetical protein
MVVRSIIKVFAGGEEEECWRQRRAGDLVGERDEGSGEGDGGRMEGERWRK